MSAPWIDNVPLEGVEDEPAPENCALISISEESWRANVPEGYADVLRLQFEDWDSERMHPPGRPLFNVRHALEIKAFAEKHRGKNIRVHCAAGVSRSAAVAEVLLRAFPEYRDAGGKRFPNGHVKRYLARAFGLVPAGAEDSAVSDLA